MTRSRSGSVLRSNVMTISDFLSLFSSADPDFLKKVTAEEYRYRGGEDCRRADAAKILHRYLKECRNCPDQTDLSSLSHIKDLYDCRICANDIAQVLLYQIMDPIVIPTGETSSLTIFDHETKITREEAKISISKACKI